MTEKLPLLYQMKEKLTGAVYGTFHLERHRFDSKPDPYGFGIIYQRQPPPALGMGAGLKGEISWACLMLQFDNQKEPLRLNPELTAELLAQRPYEEVYYFLNNSFPPDDYRRLSIEQISKSGNFLEYMERAYRLKKDKAGALKLIPKFRYTTSEERAKLMGLVGADYGRFVLEYETGHYYSGSGGPAIGATDYNFETGQDRLIYLAVQFGDEKKPVRLNKQQISQLLTQRPHEEVEALLEGNRFSSRPTEESADCLVRMKYAYRVKRHKNRGLELVPLWLYGVYGDGWHREPYRLTRDNLSFRALAAFYHLAS